jgi:hypothetical protein
MKFGVYPAFIDGSANVELAGEHVGLKWSGLNSSNEVSKQQ